MTKVTLSLTLLAAAQVATSGWLGWQAYSAERTLRATRAEIARMRTFYQRDVELTAKAGKSLEAVAKLVPCVRQENDAKLKYVLDQVVSWANVTAHLAVSGSIALGL
jgi:hypothetical protein